MRLILCSVLALVALSAAVANAATNQFLPVIPAGYHLQAYDDCGVDGRQPHVRMTNCYLWTFNLSDTDAGPKERSAVFSYQGIEASYHELDPHLTYVLALTYASDHVYHRVQSLEADGVLLHGPLALPMAEAMRVIVKVPPEVTRDGKMTLAWKIHGEVNATVSIIELWANAPASNSLRITSIAGLPSSLEGQVLDLAYDPITNASVRLESPGRTKAVTATTRTEGYFSFDRQDAEAAATGGELILVAQHLQRHCQASLSITNLFFDPLRYRPMPTKTANLKQNHLLLDGTWKINPSPGNDIRTRSLNDPCWSPFQVPGQWLQQGFTVPKEQAIAVAHEFLIPKAWARGRIVLRFDAVHAGTRYWLNSRELGYRENLFTPVEWDITEAAIPGQTNRLDLEMKVATASEALSHSSDYAFHDLGGIDRSVHLFVLPATHIRQLHLGAEPDRNCHDGDLRLRMELATGNVSPDNLTLVIKLRDPAGKLIRHSLPSVRIEPFSEHRTLDVVTHIGGPKLWSAETPQLYQLLLELEQGRTTLERLERNIGFRRLEIRGRQFYVNGQRVKLAGICHHEFDPLTGRANTARHAETDVRMLKAANLNYIRTSHYPPTAELLDAADRLGMYVEVEAPFCWVGGALDNPTNLAATLVPTSAMVDYHHSHPSVIVWSLANESHFNPQFLASARLVKELDPTRPTTFNHDMAGSDLGRTTDIANIHYPPMPYDSVLADDPRPLFLGEYFFPVCHEQTDVRINPGLRELWGMGSAEPESVFSRAIASDSDMPPLKPGIKPGGWSYIVHSDRVIGGAIWASHDDAFYFSRTNHAGYAWHHGFWGIIDYWRRPKPEWWIARHIFSPVWLETRHVAFIPGQKTVRVPVENRYAFTDFSELKFDWQIGRNQRRLKTRLAPAAKGELEIPVPAGTKPGESIMLRVTGADGTLISESAIQLGEAKPAPLPRPASGSPRWREEGNKILIQGDGFAAVLDCGKGDFDFADLRHTCAVITFPSPHVTRYDFGDLNGPNSPPYAMFPDVATRQFERLEVQEEAAGLRLTVHARYADFAGSTSWVMDWQGRGVVACDYTYTGKPMDTREGGIRMQVKAACHELRWRRWSEWGVFPPESISRVEGAARAHREAHWGEAHWNVRPAWPWSLDETELGTADFRSVKYNIYEAALVAPDGSGLSAHAHADVHFRAALAAGGVDAHVLWRCPLGQVTLKPNDHLAGECVIQLLAPGRTSSQPTP